MPTCHWKDRLKACMIQPTTSLANSIQTVLQRSVDIVKVMNGGNYHSWKPESWWLFLHKDLPNLCFIYTQTVSKWQCSTLAPNSDYIFQKKPLYILVWAFWLGIIHIRPQELSFGVTFCNACHFNKLRFFRKIKVFIFEKFKLENHKGNTGDRKIIFATQFCKTIWKGE